MRACERGLPTADMINEHKVLQTNVEDNEEAKLVQLAFKFLVAELSALNGEVTDERLCFMALPCPKVKGILLTCCVRHLAPLSWRSTSCNESIDRDEPLRCQH